jgi:hypothetical protein
VRCVLLPYHHDWPLEPDPFRYAGSEASTAELQAAGVMVDAAALQLSDTVCTVCAGASGGVVTDGPFAETKEQLGGYYLVDVATGRRPPSGPPRCPQLRTTAASRSGLSWTSKIGASRSHQNKMT